MPNHGTQITTDNHIYRLSIENPGDGKYEITMNDRTVILSSAYNGWTIEEDGGQKPLAGTNGRTPWHSALAKALMLLDADRLAKSVEQKRAIVQQWAKSSK